MQQGLTWLGALLAERYDVPDRIVSAALQFAVIFQALRQGRV